MNDDARGRDDAERPTDDNAVPLEALSQQTFFDIGGPMVTDQDLQEFLIPVHDFASFTKREVEIIDHPAFQRLFNFQQLGQTNLVYRGATHKRGEHALGTTATATVLMEALNKSTRRSPDGSSWERDDPLTDEEQAFGRLAALLHDVGHIAAGHTLEDELGVLGAHDRTDRLDFVMKRTIFGGRDLAATPIVETLGQRIDRLYKNDAEHVRLQVFDPEAKAWGADLSASQVVCHLVSKDADKNWRNYRSACNPAFRGNVLRDVVGNTICADLLDYLHRDWHYIGKPRFFDKRLIQYMELRRCDTAGVRESQVVVDLGTEGRERPDAVTAILDLLESRYQLWEIGLLHRTKTAAAAMLERAIGELMDSIGYFGGAQAEQISDALLETLYEASDLDVYRLLGSDFATTALAKVATEKTVPTVTQDLLWRLRYRLLPKQIEHVDARHGSTTGRDVSELLASAGSDQSGRLAAAHRRLQSLRLLERDFDLEPGSLAMYCTPFGLGRKYAEVRVLYRDRAKPLDAMDRDHGTELSGGHLDAQLRRFNRLWRAALFATEQARDSLLDHDLLDLLKLEFRAGVLAERRDIDMRHVAEIHASRAHSPYFGRRVLSEPVRANREVPVPWFPSEQPTALAFFED